MLSAVYLLTAILARMLALPHPSFSRPAKSGFIVPAAPESVRDRAAAALLRKESVPVLSPRRLTHLVRPTQSAVAAGIHAGLRRYPAAGDPPPDKVRRGRD